MDLGLITDWNQDCYHKAYIAVLSGNQVIEQLAAEEKTGPALKTAGSINDIEYSVLSAGAENDGS